MFRMMGRESRQGLGVVVELTKALGKVKSGNGQSQPEVQAPEA
jgi:CobQ-like glutamine amidotransferase family enzyme